jgi:hypothetical protein
MSASGRAGWWWRRLGWLAPLGALGAIGLTALKPVDDLDFWWLLAGGRYLVETGRFLTTDPFSATAQGAEWLNHAWGFELVLYGVYRAAGMTGVVLLQGIAAAAAFGVLYGLLRRDGLGRGWALGLLALGALATHGFWTPRPQLVTYLLLAVVCRLVADYQAGRAGRLWWLPVLTALWANLHGGFLAGPGLVALCAAGELAGWALGDAAGRAGGLARARALAGWSLASLAAAVVNPFHFRALLFPLAVLGDRQAQAWITEWQPLAFGHPQVLVLELLLGLALVIGLATPRPLPWRDLVVLLPMVHLGLQAVRNTPLLVIVATPIVGRAVGATAAAHWRGLPALARQGVALGAAVLVLSASSLLVGSGDPVRVWTVLRPGFGVAPSLPADAVAFLRQHGRRGAVLNEYNWGGYLIWQLYPEFRVTMDGRLAVYGPERFREHLTVFELAPGWQEALRRLAPDTALVRTGSPLVAALRASGWVVRYEDPGATVLDPPVPS